MSHLPEISRQSDIVFLCACTFVVKCNDMDMTLCDESADLTVENCLCLCIVSRAI